MGSMTPYRLRRTLRYADGREGTSLDNRTVHAPDVESAIDLAKLHVGAPPEMEVVSLLLCDPDGVVLWSNLGGGPVALPETLRSPAALGP